MRDLELSYRDDLVSFELAVLGFRAPRKNRIAVRLLSFDPVRITLEDSRRITFTNLTAGRYNLEVRGANSDGVWSEKPFAIATEVGVAVHPRDGADGEALFRGAAVALDDAKASGGNMARMFSTRIGTPTLN